MTNLTKAQEKQLLKQLKDHEHKKYKTTLEIAPGFLLENFAVYPEVLRPEKMSALLFAGWLFFNNNLYKDKTVIDMGCGSGIQGITAGLCGASKIIFSDISRPAAKNTEENIKKFNLAEKSKVFVGDLFENVPSAKANVIIFNHPFFSDLPKGFSKNLTTMIMIDGGELINRFFDEAKNFLSEDGCIVMPFFHLAGTVNNPSIVGPKHGYKVEESCRIKTAQGLQKGEISVYKLTLK